MVNTALTAPLQPTTYERISYCACLQVSDWSRRPLSARQLAYAALDAAVQLCLLDKMAAPVGPLSEDQITSLLKNWSAGAAVSLHSCDDHEDIAQGCIARHN